MTAVFDSKLIHYTEKKTGVNFAFVSLENEMNWRQTIRLKFARVQQVARRKWVRVWPGLQTGLTLSQASNRKSEHGAAERCAATSHGRRHFYKNNKMVRLHQSCIWHANACFKFPNFIPNTYTICHMTEYIIQHLAFYDKHWFNFSPFGEILNTSACMIKFTLV